MSNKKQISAEIIADSLNPQGCRLTTFILTFPRIVLAEYNTHRAFSRNSASSRAIPFKKMVEMAENDPFIPIGFQKDHKGMQGTEYFEGEEHDQCVKDWLSARDAAVNAAKSFKHDVTKQLKNRILEAYMWHRVICTATDFENFFALRAHPDAEIHIGMLAEKMLMAYNESSPKQLKEGDWHIPFGDKFDEGRVLALAEKLGEKDVQFLKCKIAVARVARISYENFEGKDDYEADIKLCDKLFGSIPKHCSPSESVAQATNSTEYIGNFRGFKQLRKFFSDENLKDSRVVQKTVA